MFCYLDIWACICFRSQRSTLEHPSDKQDNLPSNSYSTTQYLDRRQPEDIPEMYSLIFNYIHLYLSYQQNPPVFSTTLTTLSCSWWYFKSSAAGESVSADSPRASKNTDARKISTTIRAQHAHIVRLFVSRYDLRYLWFKSKRVHTAESLEKLCSEQRHQKETSTGANWRHSLPLCATRPGAKRSMSKLLALVSRKPGFSKNKWHN